jgi:hypothetical protein
MRKVNRIAIAVLSSGIAFGSVAAQAADADVSNCLQMAQQVKSALADNTQSPGYTDARKAQVNGRDFCAQGLYAQGVSYYSQALTLLSASKN